MINGQNKYRVIERPLLPVTIFYALGLLATRYTSFSLGTVFISFVLSCALFFLCFLMKKRTQATIFSFLVFFVLGIIRLYPYTHPSFFASHIGNFAGTGRVNVEGVIYKTPIKTPFRTKLYVSAKHIHQRDGSFDVHGRLLVSVKETAKNFRYGDRIRFFCYLKRPRNFANPGGFDYVRYLAYRGIYVTTFLKNDHGIIFLKRGEGNVLLLAVESLRDKIREFLNTHVSFPSREVLKSLIIGEKGTIPALIKEQFSRLGIAHLLAISGLHVGIVALVSYLFFMAIFKLYYRSLLYINAFKVSVFFSIIPVLFYCLIAGSHVPTLRAAIMVSAYIVALVLNRRQDLLHTLVLAGFVILIFIPPSVFEISFQLSFTAVLSIVLLVPRWRSFFVAKEKDPFKKKSPLIEKSYRLFIDSFLASGAAILGTAPLIMLYFHNVSFMGIFTNIIMIPLVGFIIVPLGLLAGGLLFFSPFLSGPFFHAAEMITEVVLVLAGMFARTIPGNFTLRTPELWEIGAFYLLLFGSTFYLNKSRLKYFIAGIGTCVLIEASLFFYSGQSTGMLKATFLDVGSGDAALIEFPGGKTMLIDAGGFMDREFDMGERVVAPFLYARHIRKVDILVLSHPHQDHIGGLPYIAKNFKVKELWYNGEYANNESFKELMAITRTKEIEIHTYTHNSPPRWIDGVRVDFLNPLQRKSTECSKSDAGTNNNSLVLKLTLGKVSFLFTGDILTKAEQEMISRGISLTSTILKVPHHGGKSSNEPFFVQSVLPEVAVFSCRSYGKRAFPSSTVLNRYNHAGSKIFTTERNGAITIETNGTVYNVSTYKEEYALGLK